MNKLKITLSALMVLVVLLGAWEFVKANNRETAIDNIIAADENAPDFWQIVSANSQLFHNNRSLFVFSNDDDVRAYINASDKKAYIDNYLATYSKNGAGLNKADASCEDNIEGLRRMLSDLIGYVGSRDCFAYPDSQECFWENELLQEELQNIHREIQEQNENCRDDESPLL